MRLSIFRKLSKSQQNEEVNKSIIDIQIARRELDRLGVWNIPKKMKPGIEYTIWKSK